LGNQCCKVSPQMLLAKLDYFMVQAQRVDVRWDRSLISELPRDEMPLRRVVVEQLDVDGIDQPRNEWSQEWRGAVNCFDIGFSKAHEFAEGADTVHEVVFQLG